MLTVENRVILFAVVLYSRYRQTTYDRQTTSYDNSGTLECNCNVPLKSVHCKLYGGLGLYQTVSTATKFVLRITNDNCFQLTQLIQHYLLKDLYKYKKRHVQHRHNSNQKRNSQNIPMSHNTARRIRYISVSDNSIR